MTRVSRFKPRLVLATAGLAAASLALSACAQTADDKDPASGQSGTSSSALRIGTTDKITSLDPAGSYDNGSFAVQIQVFPMLMGSPYGSPDVEPDLAESADFSAPKEYTVKLRDGVKWSDGTPITSEDVKFSFDRDVEINDENGPSSLLANLESVDAPDDQTVVFNLKQENDQTFPQVLSSPAGVIVPAEVFDADKLTDATAIVEGGKFGGQYQLTDFDLNKTVGYAKNPEYQGLHPAAAVDEVVTTYYADANNLKLEVQQGNIDVAFRSLSATDIEDLEKQDDKVKVWQGPGGEIRFLTFNFATQPYGSETEEADEAKALAVRQAVADVIDRDELSEQVYKGTFTPLYSHVPDGMTGATTALKEVYGDGNGGPDVEKAKAALEAAGVETPVKLAMQYNPDHYGPSSDQEYALIKDQLESSGLFTVDLKGTEWTQYSDDRVADVYPTYQLGWFPDYSDADNYLTPFFLRDADGNNGFLLNHYGNDKVDELITAQLAEPDVAARTAKIEEIQHILAEDLPTLPYLQGSQIAVTGLNVSDLVLDSSFKFYYGSIVLGDNPETGAPESGTAAEDAAVDGEQS